MRDRGSPEPIIAYHGSPYSFDRFSTQHLGAGEGNQAYGHGLYFAGHEPVSEWYRYQLAARRDPILKNYGLDSQDGAQIGMELATANGDASVVAAGYRKYADDLRAENARPDMATRNMIKRAEAKAAYLEDPERSKGTMYQVAIEADPKKFINWDEPLGQQAPVVQDVFKDQLAQFGPDARMDAQMKIATQRAGGHEKLAKKLAQAGVPGVKYFDEGSRGVPTVGRGRVAARGDGKFDILDDFGVQAGPFNTLAEAKQYLNPQKSLTQNFVTFSDEMVRILRKYGVVGIPAAGVLTEDGEERRATGGAVNTAMEIARKIKRKKGGAVHVGPIVGDTGGRADKVPMRVPNGSYIVPADICSGLGEGNTAAGMMVLSDLFPKSKPSRMREGPGDKVEILAADGEFCISPEDIVDRYGDLESGHKALDAWVLHERDQLIETLSNLDPPAQD